MRLLSPLRGLRLSTRLGFTLTATLVLAAVAQTVLYMKTREETLEEADASYQALAKAVEVASTQMGPEGWKDKKVLSDYTQRLARMGLRDIQVTEAGVPFPAPAPTPGKKRGGKSQTLPPDILITGVVGEGKTNSELVIPMVVDGKLYGRIKILYTLENLREGIAENFRRRLYALLGVFALGLAVLLLVTRNAVMPLHELAEATAKVAEGRLDTAVAVDRDDEVGLLAASFNRMTEKLRERQELETRLTAAEKRAEIGHLASGLAHEIKNPLNALSLGLDVLRRRHKPADATELREYSARIEAMREEINRLATLINNFLAFGRPITITPARTDFRALVESTLSDLAELAERARVTVITELPASLPELYVDGSLIKSAVWNLVQNGVQSMEQTGGTLRVSTAPLTDESGLERVALTIEDTGPGIDPADLPRLFEPYFSRKEAGVGLGLAMVKRMVEDHGGKVRAGNREDGTPGAVFVLELPVRTAVPERGAPPAVNLAA